MKLGSVGLEGLGYVILGVVIGGGLVVGGIAKATGASLGKSALWAAGGSAATVGGLYLFSKVNQARGQQQRSQMMSQCGPEPVSQEQRALWYDCMNNRRSGVSNQTPVSISR